MPEVLTSVDNLFESEAFGLQLTEWQRARMRADEADGRFEDYIVDWFSTDGQLPPEMEETVDYYVGMDRETFEATDFFDEQAHELSRLRDGAQDSNKEKKSLLDVSRGQGGSDFALYGLDLHLGSTGLKSVLALKEKVKAAENDLNTLDALVRNNAGNVFTVIDLYPQAGRLGEGGLSLVNNDRIVFPRLEGSQTFGTTVFKDMPDIESSDKPMSIRAHEVHSIFGSRKRMKVIENWSGVLDTSILCDPGDGAMFVVGEVVEGPPVVNQDRDEDFVRMVFERVRTIGIAAASQSLEG